MHPSVRVTRRSMGHGDLNDSWDRLRCIAACTDRDCRPASQADFTASYQLHAYGGWTGLTCAICANLGDQGAYWLVSVAGWVSEQRSRCPSSQRDASAAELCSLTVPVAEGDVSQHITGRKRPRYSDLGSTTDLLSLPERRQSHSSVGVPPATTSEDVDSHIMDLYTLQQLPGHDMQRDVSLDGPVSWFWQPHWADRPDPVPARLVEVASICRPKHLKLSADVQSSLEFSHDGMLLATAGRAKHVRVYAMAGLDSDAGDDAHFPIVASHRMPSKLSSIAWSPDDAGIASVGDYDGVVSQLDLTSGRWLGDQEDPLGSRIWNVVHSHLRRHLVACSSDNGTIQLWGGRGLQQSAGCVAPSRRAAVCCTAFSSLNEHLMAAACADTNAYIFDLRQLSKPLQVLKGHTEPLAFVKFLGSRLITSSVDSTLGWWNLEGPSPHYGTPPLLQFSGPGRLRTISGHTNHKNFVGLSVREADSLIACGSEMGQAFAYHTSWDTPLAAAPVHRSGSNGARDVGCNGQPVTMLGHGPWAGGIGYADRAC
ncbi:hypothetical protein WJX73_005769 [Symbiochloris irregularis]|uniref:Uncharacterized protein n=1 Tax=Symbiochloris irregularis TaxID=706552 RepID=A0AAW1NTL8_9CHLO